jgi:tetratricopeptide (TPR) repeat protein
MADLTPEQQTLSIQQALDLAAQHQTAGRLPEAESIYQKIVESSPNQPVALHQLGLIAYEVGKPDVAVELISKALAAKPDYAIAHFNLGVVLRGFGQLDEAAASFQNAVASRSDYGDAHYNLGVALQEQGKLDEAAASYGKALALKPDFAEGHNNLGVTLQDLGRLDDAAASFRQALAINPEYAEAHYNLGNTFEQQGRREDAIASYRKALAINPDYAEAHSNLGAAYKELGKFDEALESYQKALAIRPDFADAHSNLGAAFKELGKLDEAIASCNRALAIDPEFTEAHNNLGSALNELGRQDEAVASFQNAIAIKPDYAEAHTNLSLVLLSQGKLKAGWEENEWRSKTRNTETRTLPIEMWPGSSLRGKSALVYAEQGIGDEIMFASCLPDLLEQSPGKLFLECDPRLEALFARSFPSVRVYGKTKDMDLSWLGDNARLDYALPIGSLPKFFRNRVEDFPDRGAYLTPHPELIAKWTQRLAGLQKGLKIGISWRGGSTASVIKKASIPLLELRPLLSVDASFINLQYGDVSQELAMLGDVHIHDWQDNDPLTDIDNQAALISCLDLVITIDNATVHLSGALGTPTWALIENISDWRWARVFGDSPPLYRSVRLFRQQRPFEWDAVIDRVMQSLKEMKGIRS